MKKFYWILFILISATGFNASAQNTSLNCTRDTTIACAIQCITLQAKVPDARGSSNDYIVNRTAGGGEGCYNEIVDPATAGPSTGVTADDRYSGVIDLPFTFSFYGIDFTQVVVSGNGVVCFDITEATQFAAWGLNSTNGTSLGGGGTGVDLPSDLYERAVIFGPNHDINPATTTSPDRKMKYTTYGTAPNRVWVLSYYKIPLFSCTSLIENTQQIALYEGTGIIEVFIKDKQICTTWNQGKAMVGLQDYNRTKGIIAPGRAATDAPWGSIGMNEKWRFIPAEGAPLFRFSELLNSSGTVISTADTAGLGNNVLGLSFPNVCPTASNQYIIKTTYASYNDPTQMVTYYDTVNVIRDALLTATTDIVTADCSNNYVGSVTITVDGAGPFEYSNDGGITWQDSNVFNLGPGSHIISYRIVGAECSSSSTIVIPAAPGLPAISYALTNVLCNGNTTGAINVTVASTEAFQYSINGGTTFQATGAFPDLAAGTYVVAVKDAGDCRKDTTIIVLQPDPIILTPVTENSNCFSQGRVILTANGGTPGYTYSIDNGVTFQGSNIFNVNGGASNNFVVRDASGCTATLPNVVAEVTNNIILEVLPSPINVCDGGTVTLLTTGNATTYSWNPPASLDNPNAQSPVATPPTGTTIYTVTATLGSCQKQGTVVVTAANLVVNVIPTSTVCEGESITLTTTGNADTYQWSPATGLDNPTAQSPIATPPPGGITYTVTASLGTCNLTPPKTVRINTVQAPTVSTIPNATICAGGSITLTTTGDATSYNWTPSTGLNNPSIQSPVATPTAASTTYTVIGYLGTCASTPASVTITTGEGLTVNAGTPRTITEGESITLDATAPGATVFTWTPSLGLSSTSILNPVASPLQTQLYTLTARDNSGCSGTDNVLITVRPVDVDPGCINVSNAFSPNGDGINEVWTVYDNYSCLKNVTVHVFNRYGSKVFESKDYRNTWDGTYKTRPVPDGTYYAVIDFTLTSGKVITKKTDVTVIR